MDTVRGGPLRVSVEGRRLLAQQGCGALLGTGDRFHRRNRCCFLDREQAVRRRSEARAEKDQRGRDSAPSGDRFSLCSCSGVLRRTSPRRRRIAGRAPQRHASANRCSGNEALGRATRGPSIVGRPDMERRQSDARGLQGRQDTPASSTARHSAAGDPGRTVPIDIFTPRFSHLLGDARRGEAICRHEIALRG